MFKGKSIKANKYGTKINVLFDKKKMIETKIF